MSYLYMITYGEYSDFGIHALLFHEKHLALKSLEKDFALVVANAVATVFDNLEVPLGNRYGGHREVGDIQNFYEVTGGMSFPEIETFLNKGASLYAWWPTQTYRHGLYAAMFTLWLKQEHGFEDQPYDEYWIKQ